MLWWLCCLVTEIKFIAGHIQEQNRTGNLEDVCHLPAGIRKVKTNVSDFVIEVMVWISCLSG